MQALEEYSGSCPYCGETVSLLVDYSAGAQRTIEDCSVCCRPIVVTLTELGNGAIEVSLRHENETD